MENGGATYLSEHSLTLFKLRQALITVKVLSTEHVILNTQILIALGSKEANYIKNSPELATSDLYRNTTVLSKNVKRDVLNLKRFIFLRFYNITKKIDNGYFS